MFNKPFTDFSKLSQKSINSEEKKASLFIDFQTAIIFFRKRKLDF